MFNKSTYSISVNLEGPKTNQFRIYYQDTNGALYPLITPDVINFEINTGGQNSLQSIGNFDEFYYHKLGLSNDVHQMLEQQAFDPSKVKLVLIPNMILNPLTG